MKIGGSKLAFNKIKQTTNYSIKLKKMLAT